MVPLRVLLLEDNAHDAELILNELRRAGFAVESERVVSEAEFQNALEHPERFDIILADYRLPQYDGIRALNWVLAQELPLPIIIISGAIGEELAVEAMKRGAADYLLKDCLGRLGQAVAHTLREQELRAQARLTAEALEASASRFRTLADSATDAIISTDQNGVITFWNKAASKMYGYSSDRILGKPVTLLFPSYAHSAFEKDMRAFLTGQDASGPGGIREVRARKSDGTEFPAEISFAHWEAQNQIQFIIIVRDVTARKRTEASLQKRDAILSAVAYAAQEFLDSDDWTLAWRNTLARLGAATGTRRVYLFENERTAQGAILTHQRFEWVAEGITPQMDNPDLTPFPLRTSGLARWFESLEHGEAVEIPVSDFPPPERAVAQAQGIDSILFLSLFVADTWWGLVGFERHTGDSEWSHVEVEALRAASDILTSAIRRQQVQAAEQKQRILAEALRDTAVVLNTSLDLDNVLDQILLNVRRVTEYDVATVFLLQDGIAKAVRRAPESEMPANNIRFVVKDTQNLRMMSESGQPHLIPDTRLYPGWIQPENVPQELSVLGAPIRGNDLTIGFVNLGSYRENAFSKTHLENLQAFADVAGMALVNARLLQETTLRAHQFELLYEAGLALNGSLEPSVQTELLYQIAMRAIGADRAQFYSDDSASGEFTIQFSAGFSEETRVRAQKLRLNANNAQGLGNSVVKDRVTLNIPDLKADKRYIEIDPELRSGLWVPVERNGRLLAIVSMFSTRVAAFSEQDQRLMELFSNQAAVALENARLFVETRQHLRQIESLRVIDRAISSSFDLDGILEIFLDQLFELLTIDAANILLANRYAPVLEFAQGRGFRTTALRHTHLRYGDGYAGKAALHRELVFVPDLSTAMDGLERAHLLSREEFVSYLAAPLTAKGQVVGVLELFTRTPLVMTDSLRELVQILGQQAAIAIDNVSLFDDLRRANTELRLAYDATIEGWSRALDLRDKETQGHTQRVTAMTLRLARAMGISEADLVHWQRGALLHDIGKLGIPDVILFKSDKLTEEEWTLMRQHPQMAYDLLSPIAYLRPALDIPLYHHERWDGKGYPRGLKGEQIPLAARVFAVVDVWDALSSDRPYRKAWSDEQVRAYLQEQAGSQFDPEVVRAFLLLYS
jgi:PAS domain S-box-containing protein